MRRYPPGNRVSSLISGTLQGLLLVSLLLLSPFGVFPTPSLVDSSIELTANEPAMTIPTTSLETIRAPTGDLVPPEIAGISTPIETVSLPGAAAQQSTLPVAAPDSPYAATSFTVAAYQESAGGTVLNEPAAAENAGPIAIEPLLGYYSPNTIVELRSDGLWFVRPPYESPLVPTGDGSYYFTQGWLAGRLSYFSRNDAGGVSMMLLSDTGSWNEFARSGEIYNDLDPALAGRLAHILDQTIAETNVPGAILYVYLPGQGRWIGARGVSNVAQGIPMVPLDRIRIASVTKTFVATVILQLVSEGVLSLDDPVSKWLPGLVPNGNNITLRHLLNHTSGLYNYLDDGFVDLVLSDRSHIWSPQELVGYAVANPPYFAPGQAGRWHYSNTNYIVLGMVIERATGTPLAQQVRWRILEPLGMHNTYFDPDDGFGGGTVRGYVGGRDYTDLNMSFAWAAGGMVSTLEDLGRFMQALSGGALLDAQGMQSMHSFSDVYGAWGASQLTYGMGLMQDVMSVGPGPDGQPRPPGQGLVRGHTGGLTGYRSAMWYLPESRAVVIAAVNQMYYDPNILITSAMDEVLTYYDQTRTVAGDP